MARARLQLTTIRAMTHTSPHGFPSRSALLRFLRERSPVTLDEASRVLGSTVHRMLHLARENNVLLPGDRMPWEDVAFELFSAWPRALVLDTLGDAVDVVPKNLHLTRPAWDIPIYLVRAMEAQARALRDTTMQRRRGSPVRGVDDHVADLLHQAINPDAITALRCDDAFVAAYEYPHGPNGARREAHLFYHGKTLIRV